MRRPNPDVSDGWQTAQQSSEALADWADRYGEALAAVYGTVCTMSEVQLRAYNLIGVLDSLEAL